MTEIDPIEQVKAGTQLIGEVLKAAGDNPDTKAAGGELGKSALTVTTTINNVLLPLAMVNFAFSKAKEYFQTKFESELAEKTADIPPDRLIEPKASVAGPTLQGLAFSHEEPDLKEMYLSLLKSAMDAETANVAHPAFVDVIKQLTADEAKLIRFLLKGGQGLAMVELRATNKSTGTWQTKERHLLPLINVKTSEPVVLANGASLVDNLSRLGLVILDYSSQLSAPKAYDWVEARPEFSKYQKSLVNEEQEITSHKGILEVSDFGEQFGKGVGIL